MSRGKTAKTLPLSLCRELVLLCLLLMSFPLTAEPLAEAQQQTPASKEDEVTRIMAEAKDAYQRNQYLKAGRLLQQAMNIVADLQESHLKTLFPKPGEGWQTTVPDESDQGSLRQALQLFGGGGLVEHYQHQQQTEQRVQLALLNNPPGMLNVLLDTLSMMTLGQSQSAPVTLAGQETMVHCKSAKECYLVLHLPNKMIFLAHGIQVERRVMLDFAERFNFAGLTTD